MSVFLSNILWFCDNLFFSMSSSTLSLHVRPYRLNLRVQVTKVIIRELVLLMEILTVFCKVLNPILQEGGGSNRWAPSFFSALVPQKGQNVRCIVSFILQKHGMFMHPCHFKLRRPCMACTLCNCRPSTSWKIGRKLLSKQRYWIKRRLVLSPWLLPELLLPHK